MVTSKEIVVEGGNLYGPWRRSRNRAGERGGNLHNDATAQQLGFRGGAVAGIVHFELFPPLLLKAWGQRWFERGTLSMDFKYATVDAEEVRAIIGAPPSGDGDSQASARVERPDGTIVEEGTASVGDSREPTCLSLKDIHRYEAGEYSMIEDVRPGDSLHTLDVAVTLEQAQQRQEGCTEPLPWYVGESPWGGPIASPTALCSALSQPWRPYLHEREVQAVALWGAAELRNIEGPVFVGQSYRAGGEVIARGQSPKTEYFWTETYLDDTSGRRVAEMQMQLRLLKESNEVAVPTW